VRGLPSGSRHQLPCRLYAPLRGTIDRAGTGGTNFVKFEGRIGGRWMKPGRYLLVAGATDPAGNATRLPLTAGFKIVH
jgi:hypothetical protein